MVLTLGVSGLTFSGAADVGFFGNPDAELMTRWYQVGTHLIHFSAGHAATSRRKPENRGFPRRREHGDHSHGDSRAIRALPYIYTLFEESHRVGAPVLRPLWYEFPNLSESRRSRDKTLSCWDPPFWFNRC